MQNIRGLFHIGVWVLLLPGVATAQAPLRWQPTLQDAKRLAAQTNRLVLIHFWADWCQACQEMDRDVFSQPSVASVVEGNYVAVKINAAYFPATCKQFGVTALPTDVIISPEGHPIDKLQGLFTASEYVARVSRVAAAARRSATEVYAQAPAGQLPAPAARGYRSWNTAGYQSPTAEQPPDPRYAEYSTPQGRDPNLPAYSADYHRPPIDARAGRAPRSPQAATPPQPAQPWGPMAGPAEAGPSLPSASGGPPLSNPPLGLDGYCPVQLSDDMKANLFRWTMGDRRWGAIHRGRTYLFAGPQQQQRFLADPDRYAPVLSGNDVVIALEQGRAVPGRREHGVLFYGQIYLFADEASLEKFARNPQHYASRVFQAMRAEGSQRQAMR
jgi:YHS domain-containing protein/thioredoxin-related protein